MSERSANAAERASSVSPPPVTTGVYRRGGTFWIRYHGPRRNGTWGQICESARTRDPEEARRLRQTRLEEVARHRDGTHLFRGPYHARSFSVR